MNTRPEFMTPKPRFLKRASKVGAQVQEERNIPSVLCKRKYGEEFGDSFEDQRYNQHINEQFFQSNIGHGVVAPVLDPVSILNTVIADFRQDLGSFLATTDKKEQPDSGKLDISDILEWCEYYMTNKPLFNV